MLPCSSPWFQLASDNLVPDFGHGYFKISVSLGVIAAYCLLPVIAAGLVLYPFFHR